MNKLFLIIFLLPIALLGQTIPEPIDNDPGTSEDTDGLAGSEVYTVSFKITGDLNITGDLVVSSGIVSPLPDDSPDPDPMPGDNPLPPEQNENPTASFTYTPTSGDITLTVNFTDTSTDSDGTIASRLWTFGDGSTSTATNPSHDYTVAGNYNVTLQVTDDDGATSTTQPKVVNATAVAAPLPEYDMVVEEVGHMHVSLSWTDIETWEDPWIIQRSTTAAFTDPTDLTNNQAANNTGAGTFRFLGINAQNYIDLDGIAEGTQYYYRVGTVTNLSDHYQNSATPTFGPWIYGTATTTTLASGKKLTYNITSATYAGGAVSGDGLNDWPAIDAALTAAEAAGGGIIYIPAGTWDVWPTDADVDIVGGYPELENGESYNNTLFTLTSDNITFLGDQSAGVPTTLISLYLWGKEPATKWLKILTGASGSAVSNVKRYFVFKPDDVQNIKFQNLDFEMGAVPVDTGKGWYSLDEKRYEWDVSHKLFASFDLERFKNVVFDNVHASNCRGEMIYNGGSSEKILIKDCDLRVSNSSTISGSFDLELVDTIIADSANGAVESNIRSDQTSFFTSQPYKQHHIARGCTFIGLDQTASGVMKNLPGDKAFNGWLCFNQSGTYQSVTDSTFTDFVFAAFAPWYEYRNGLRFNCTFNGFPTSATGHIFYTWTSAQGLYNLDGGMSEILWLGDTINMDGNWPNHQVFFYSQPGAAATGNESPWIWEAVHIDAASPSQLNRLWVDTWNLTSGRQNAVFKDWTHSSNVTFDSAKFQFLGANHIDPNYINFLD